MLRSIFGLAGEGLAALFRLIWWLIRLLLRGIFPLIRRSLREAAYFLAISSATLLRRTLPETSPRSSYRQRYIQRVNRLEQADLTGNPLLIGMGLILPLLAIALVGFGYYQVRAFRGERFARYMASARTKMAQAQVMASAPEAERLLRAAKQEAQMAYRLRPGDAQARELQIQAQDQLDEILRIERLYWLPELRKLGDAALPWVRLWTQGRAVYILEGGSEGRLWQLTLNEAGDDLTPAAKTTSPMVLGTGGEAVGRLVDLAGDGQKLAILGARGMLYLPHPGGGLEILRLGKGTSSQEPSRMAFLGSDLLLLVPGENRILRYAAQKTGFAETPTDYLKPDVVVMLKDAQDMASDGQSLYVLLKNGQVLKFWNGLSVAFDMRGLRTPLKEPVAIYADPRAKSIYIADRGNGRIVELAKDGTFRQEYRPREGAKTLGHLEGLAVDEEAKRIYILDSASLYLAALPQEKKP